MLENCWSNFLSKFDGKNKYPLLKAVIHTFETTIAVYS